MDSKERQVTRDDANGARVASALTGRLKRCQVSRVAVGLVLATTTVLARYPQARGRWDKPGDDSGCDSNDRNRAGPAVARPLVPSLTRLTSDTLPPKPIRCVLQCGLSSRTVRVARAIPSLPSQSLTDLGVAALQRAVCGSHFRNLSRSKALAPVSGRPNGVRGERWLLHRKSFLLGLFGAAGLIKSKSH